MKTALYIPTPAHIAYEALPIFQEYLADRKRWETDCEAYNTIRNPVTYNAMVISEHRMKVALRMCRETPEHLAAFGW